MDQEIAFRPWWRSRLTWLALLGLVFLIFVWDYSCRYQATWMRLSPSNAVGVNSGYGGFTVFRTDLAAEEGLRLSLDRNFVEVMKVLPVFGFGPVYPRWGFQVRAKMDLSRESLFASPSAWSIGSHPGGWGLFLPCWMLVALYRAAWAAVFACRVLLLRRAQSAIRG